MAFSDDEKKEIHEIYKNAAKDGFLEGLKQYDSERAEWEANVEAQNSGKDGKGNDNSGDNKPAPTLAERLLGGSGKRNS